MYPGGNVSGFSGSRSVLKSDGEPSWNEDVEANSLAGKAGESNVESELAKSESSEEGHESRVAVVVERVKNRSSRRKTRMMMLRDLEESRRYVKTLAGQPAIVLD